MIFNYQVLLDKSNHNRALVDKVAQGELYQGSLWGAFSGLFGPASNQLIVVSVEDDPQKLVQSNSYQVSSELWTPTARPTNATPCHKQGLYVFRRFFVMEDHVEALVTLSKQAWETFENDTSYAAEPLGLFQPNGSEEGVVAIMLLTWYDGFASWQTSRTPHPEAKENFSKRQALTLATSAMATRLESPPVSLKSIKSVHNRST